MGFWKQIGIGFKGYFKALGLLFTWKFFRYMFFPLLFNILIFWVGLSVINDFAVDAREWFKEWISLEGAEFWGSGFLKGAVSFLITFLFNVIFLLAFMYLGGYIIIIIMSPLFSIISEKTEHVLTNHAYDYPFELKQLIIDVFRGIGIAVRNIAIETVLLILVFIIGLILSFISWIGVIFMFFVTSYFYGFSYMDYSNERYKRNVKQSVKFMRKYKWVAIVNGSFFAIVLFIPYIGIALSAFVAVLSVIAATVSMYEIKKKEDEEIDKVFHAEV
jgi:CysZ protein